jgi:hypothetical protein
MKVLVFSFFFLLACVSYGQNNNVVSHRVVLNSDSSTIFGRKHSSLEFSDSYFMYTNVFGIAFTDKEFTDLVQNCERDNFDVKVFKNQMNKEIMFIFPKQTGISSDYFETFMKTNFHSNSINSIEFTKTTLIEARPFYDPLDRDEEKGF